MDTRSFLEAVWPATGIYCLATPFTIPDTTKQTYAHYTYNSIDDVVAAVKRMDKTNVFFAVHTLKQPKVWNENKRNHKTGEMGAYEVRPHENMAEARCFFFDLDVGESTVVTPKYATQQEALDGLEAFLFQTRLPDPLVASSGSGLHVYWPLSSVLPSSDWRRHAAILYQVAKRDGLLVDPSRTTDQSSVLRVVGTLNQKPGREPRPCAVIQAGVVTPTADFLAQITELLGDETVYLGSTRQTRRPIRGNLRRTWDGPVRTLDEVAEVCEHVRNYREIGYTEGGYVAFYNIGCGVIPFTEDGEAQALEIGMRHPRATEDYVETTIDTWNERTDGAPASCATLDAKCGGDACTRCPFASLGKNPLQIATAVVRAKAAKALLPETVAYEPICEPPFPYKRTPRGIAQTITKTAQGAETEETILICTYDMFPYNVCERTELEQAFSMWAVTIPKIGQRIIKFTSGTIQDAKALHLMMLDHGVFLTPKQLEKVREMMLHYLRTVQEEIAADRQHDHLGWVDKAKTEFIMPTAVLSIDGTSKPCMLSAMAKSSLDFVHSCGTLEASVAAMEFYNRPEYLKHQFILMMSLAAPMFHATGHAGVVVNASGDSGGSKSTALYAAGSFWGDPEAYVVNGTKDGSTLLARQETIFTLSNLPVCIDEISKMDPIEAQHFVFNATQRKPRIRAKSDGTLRAIRTQYKSTPLLCSSNSSLHNLLEIDNRAGVAGSMRVFEMFFPKFDEKRKPEAGAFMREINKHYGHIGPAMLAIYMAKREEIDVAIVTLMDTIDRKFKITAPERFWSAAIAAALVAGQLARQAGLLPFDTAPVRDWLLGAQLAEMRGQIGAEEIAQGPTALLAAFLNDKAAQTITVYPPTHPSGDTYASREPHGAIVAHHDTGKNVIYVRKDAFRSWCDDHRKNGVRTLGELQRLGLIVAMDKRITLGAGTKFASGRSVCFTVDMSHPEFALVSTPNKVVPLRQQVKEVNQ